MVPRDVLCSSFGKPAPTYLIGQEPDTCSRYWDTAVGLRDYSQDSLIVRERVKVTHKKPHKVMCEEGVTSCSINSCQTNDHHIKLRTDYNYRERGEGGLYLARLC